MVPVIHALGQVVFSKLFVGFFVSQMLLLVILVNFTAEYAFKFNFQFYSSPEKDRDGPPPPRPPSNIQFDNPTLK